MKNKKTSTLKKIIIGIVIALLVGGSSPWWWNKYINPPRVPPPVIKTQEIYRKGNKTLEFKGVYIKPPSNNTSDSYIFKSIDLELGEFTSSSNSDLGISINVQKLLISMSLKEGALIGNTETTFLGCTSLLKTNNGKKLVVSDKKIPTPFYCTETNEGRVSQFTFTSIKKYSTPVKDTYSIIIELKYTTWQI